MKKNIRLIIVAASSLAGAAIGLFATMPKKKVKEETVEETAEEKVAPETPSVPKEILEAAEKINKFIAPKAEEAIIPSFTTVDNR